VYIDRRSGGYYVGSGARVEARAVDGPARSPRTAGSTQRAGDHTMNPILETELEKLRAVYIETREDEAVWQGLWQTALVILSGSDGTGRRATALHNLARLQMQVLYELSPDTALVDVKEDDIPRHVGLFAESPTGNVLEGLQHFALTRLLRELRKKDSALVVTTTALPAQLPADCAQHIVRRTAADGDSPVAIARRQDMLVRHLRYHLEDTAEARRAEEDLAAAMEVQELLQDPLQPGEVDQLSQLLAETLASDEGLVYALGGFRRRVREQIERWFSEERPLADSLLMVAAAVFSGAAYSDVVAASQALEELIMPPQGDEQQDEPPKPAPSFRSNRSRRLQAIGAHIEPTPVTGEYGEVNVDALVLNSPAWQPEVINYLYREDLFRAELVQWLREYGYSGHADLRHRAAAALGHMARLDFPYIKKEVLELWADSLDHDLRMAVGVALGVAAWDEEVASAVLGLLHHWATGEDWLLQWTAATAHGGLTGARYPLRALDDLRAIASADDTWLVQPVSQSLSTLFGHSQQTPEFARWVLEALLEWTSDRKQAAGIVGLIAFVELARVPDRPRQRHSRWELLLQHADNDEHLLDLTTALLRRTLNFKPTRDEALSAIKGWLERADPGASTSNATEAILGRIMVEGSQRERDRLRYYRRVWKSDSRH